MGVSMKCSIFVKLNKNGNKTKNIDCYCSCYIMKNMAQDKVRFVQACTHDDGIEVELGIEDEGTRLYYKMCSEEECYRIFLDFDEDRFVPDMKEYKPVEF